MFEYLTNIVTDYWNYYYLMIVISLIIGLMASYIHKTGIPILWTIILSGILHFGYEYLNPMINGLYNFDYINYTVLSIMLMIFAVLWSLIMLLTHYNLIMEGEVVL